MFAHTIRNCRRFQEQIERLGMNETERGLMRELLALFDRASAAANASYFVYGGSLLGFREGRKTPDGRCSAKQVFQGAAGIIMATRFC